MKLNKILKIGALLGTAFAMTSVANAAFISGGISLAGGYTVDTLDLNTANGFTSFSTFTTGVSGDFAPIGTLTAITQNPFSFDPFPGAGVNPLWTYTSGPKTYSFNLSSPIFMDQPGDSTLTLKGTGMMNITGFTSTPGTWTFTANQAGSTFSFSSSNAAVPDGGTTVALLGLSLLGLHGVRRKFSNR